MDFKSILSKILGKADSSDYLSRYDEKYDHLNELFIEPLDVDRITDSPILLLLDEQPHSLISIAYALRFAIDIPSKIYVIAEETHAKIIREEASELSIDVEFLLMKDEYELIDMENEIALIDVGFIVTSIRHHLVDDLLDTSPIPIFLTKID